MGNMFRCTLASGGALILTVTTDSTFAAQTITCTDGTTTLTQVFPSVSPYSVTFKIPNSGTWTISSGTVSESITIPDSIEIHDTPTGSTATPTDDIQTLLHCVNIWDKNYTTISALLSDTTSLLAVISDNNAVDYLVRSTTFASDMCADSTAMTYIGTNDYCADTLLSDSTWRNEICNSTYFESVLNVKVPTMTSNTSPSGTCSASSTLSDNYPYKAFNGTNSNAWKSLGDNSPNVEKWVQYAFPSAVKCYKVLITPLYNNEPKDARILGSSDGSNFTQLASKSGNISNDTVLVFSTVGNYQYYRLAAKSNRGDGQVNIGIINYYGRAIN